MNDQDKNSIIELIKAGKQLPKEYIYKLFADEEDVFISEPKDNYIFLEAEESAVGIFCTNLFQTCLYLFTGEREKKLQNIY